MGQTSSNNGGEEGIEQFIAMKQGLMIVGRDEALPSNADYDLWQG